MKNLVALLLLCQTASFALAITNTEVRLLANSDSVETANEIVPEHYPSMFNADKLESATNAKYIGAGLSLAGGLVALGGAPDAGVAVAVVGAIVGFFGRIGQDIQLVRLGWKHERRLGLKRGRSLETPSLGVGCPKWATASPSNLQMMRLRGEIIGIMESAVGCQIIVRYAFEGEFKTSTLAPGSLTKL